MAHFKKFKSLMKYDVSKTGGDLDQKFNTIRSLSEPCVRQYRKMFGALDLTYFLSQKSFLKF